MGAIEGSRVVMQGNLLEADLRRRPSALWGNMARSLCLECRHLARQVCEKTACATIAAWGIAQVLAMNCSGQHGRQPPAKLSGTASPHGFGPGPAIGDADAEASPWEGVVESYRKVGLLRVERYHPGLHEQKQGGAPPLMRSRGNNLRLAESAPPPWRQSPRRRVRISALVLHWGTGVRVFHVWTILRGWICAAVER